MAIDALCAWICCRVKSGVILSRRAIGFRIGSGRRHLRDQVDSTTANLLDPEGHRHLAEESSIAELETDALATTISQALSVGCQLDECLERSKHHEIDGSAQRIALTAFVLGRLG